MPPLPYDLGKIINSLGTVIAKFTNPFTPLLLFNLLVDTFTIVTFLVLKYTWILIPAVVIWLFTGVMYSILITKAPHMLSSTSIQKFGMELHGLGEKDKELSENIIEAIPSEEYTPAIVDEVGNEE